MSSSGLSSFLTGFPHPETVSASTQYPLWLSQAMEAVINSAGSTAQQPYQPFPGPTVATPSAQTTQAEALAGSNVGAWQPAVQQAQTTVNNATQPISAADISAFMNPYQDYITKGLDTNLQQNILPGIQDKFVSAGQSRSPQEAQITGQGIYNTQQAVGQSLAGGYQGALNSLLQQRQQQIQGGAAQGTLGALQSQLGAVDTGQLAAAGATQDQNAQANINSAMNQFTAQQQYPYQQLGFLANIINGLPVQYSGSQTNTVGNNSLYNGVSPLLAFANTLTASNASGFKRGGQVMPFRRPAQQGALSHMRMAA